MSRSLQLMGMGLLMVGLLGCQAAVTPIGGSGGDDGGGQDGGDDGGQNGGTTELAMITFEAASGFTIDSTDVTFTIDGRDVRFIGGFALSRAILALYGEGVNAWMINSSMEAGRVDLAGLNVVGARFFWAHLDGNDVAQLTWTDSNGTTSAPIVSAAVPGNNAIFEIEAAEGTTIERLDLTFAADAAANTEASLDSLVLIVADGA